MRNADSPVFDVIVVGAGIEGSASAYHLAKNNQKTLLLEQFPLPHSRGSSHGQSRITRYAYPQDFYTNMMKEAYPMWSTLSQEAEVQIFKECGLLNLGKENGPFLTSVSSALSRHGLGFESLTPQQLRERYPMLSCHPSCGAVLDPKAGILRADRALAAFQSVFKRNGGVIRDGEPVTDIVPGQPYVTVATVKGQYRGKSVVVATGPWSPKLLAGMGLRLPLKPMRMTVCYWRETTKNRTHSSDRLPCLIDSGELPGHEDAYGLPSEEYPGHVKLCLHVGPEIDPDNRDDAEDGWVRERLTNYIRNTLPALHPKPSIVESCIYTVTPDGHPVIDRHPMHNIIVATGFSGHGFKLAPAVGKAVTELVLQRPPSYDMKPFAISRFPQNTAKL